MSKENLIDFSKYEISKDGSIFSKSRNKNRKLKGYIDDDGYATVKLKYINGKRGSFQWHRVIWHYFNGEIPDGMQINHIDENKTNNAISNLNLLTPKDNCNWGTRNERMGKKLTNRKDQSKPLEQFDLLTNETIAIFPSQKEAARDTGFRQGDISRCCNGGYFCKSRNKWINITQYNGYGWKFV